MAAGGRVVRFGPFEVDLAAGEVRKRGRRVRVQEKPFLVLQALLERPGAVVLRDELRARLWPADTFVDFDNGLNNAVNKIRAALGDSAADPVYVETVGRRGYRFVGSLDADSLVAPATGAGARPAPAPLVTSLAVLPLADLSPGDREDYFADGMTDALISQLASIRSLRVISRQSIVRYKDSRAPLPKIAGELRVDALIEGSVMRTGGRVRINVQLVLGATDQHLWSGRWDREMSDVLALQAEIAREAAEVVAARVTADESSRLRRVPNIDPAAYDFHLKGRYLWRKRTREGLLRSVDYYRRAIELEPAFALAYAAEAESLGPLGYLGFVAPDESTPAMRAAATRALELDPDLVEGLTALAACEAFHEWRWREAEAHFLRAIELNPNHSVAYLWYGLLLEIEGRQQENLAARKQGLALDPFNLRAQAVHAWALFMAGSVDEAIHEFRGVLELDPHNFFGLRDLAIVDVVSGRCDEAAAAFERVAEYGSLAHALASAGRLDEARAAMARLDEAARQRYVSPVQHALAWLGLGDAGQALASLERAVAIRAIDAAAVRVDPRFVPLRQEPRFQAVMRAMNLPDAGGKPGDPGQAPDPSARRALRAETNDRTARTT